VIGIFLIIITVPPGPGNIIYTVNQCNIQMVCDNQSGKPLNSDVDLNSMI
jgi:hypothetical protein